MTPYTVAFDRETDPDPARLGGKCASLVRTTTASGPVPPGFAVTTGAFASVVDGTGLRERIDSLLAGADPADHERLKVVCARVRAMILEREIPPSVLSAIDAACEELMERCGGEVPVAVRSSATAEDLMEASFAGQQDTFLWVRGRDAVARKIRECWASLYTARAVAYRLARGVPHAGLAMGVGVQRMVDARVAGVAMTLDPATGDRSKIVVDASWGVGEPVVSGEVTPDNFVLDKVMLTLIRRTVSEKSRELVCRPGDSRPVLREVEKARRTVPCLTDEELTAVARMAKAAERCYGMPQDVEWALDRSLPAGEDVVLLQCRPETVWSRRPGRRRPTGSGAGVASITRTLLAQTSRR